MAVRKSIEIIEWKEWNDKVAEVRIKLGGKTWRVITVYSQRIEETIEEITRGIEENEEELLLIGGDLNARVGWEGGPFKDLDLKHAGERKAKDRVINREGRILLERMGERGWMILNGCFGKKSDWTYIGEKGMSTIDYAIANDRACEEILDVKEGERTESDHVPIEVKIENLEKEIVRKRSEREKDRETMRSDWSEEGIGHYHRNSEGWKAEGKDVESIWREIKEKMEISIKKEKMKIKRWELGERKWHSKEWKKRRGI